MMKEDYLDIPGKEKLYFRKTGHGPVLVLLHGFPCDGSLWNRVVPALSQGFTVLLPDLPGAGRSPLQEGQTIDSMAAAIAVLLREVAGEPAVVAGHSMGGYVALALAEQAPEWISGLALVHSTAQADNEEKVATRRKAIALIEKGGKSEFTKALVPGLFAPVTRTNNPGLLQQALEQAMALPAEIAVTFYNAMIQRPDRTNVIKGLKCPVQWVAGREDSVIPLESILPQTMLADTNFVNVINDSGHMSMLEQPEALQDVLLAFAQACTGTGTFANTFSS